MNSNSKPEQLLVLTDIIKVMVSNADTGNRYAIFEEHVPPLGGPPPHTHPDEEVFYILEGEFEFVLNDLANPFKVFPGSVVHVPSQAIHAFKNVGNTSGKMIVILTPGRLLDYFRCIGETMTISSEMPDMNKIPDLAKLNVQKVFQYAPEHDVKFILPDVIKN